MWAFNNFTRIRKISKAPNQILLRFFIHYYMKKHKNLKNVPQAIHFYFGIRFTFIFYFHFLHWKKKSETFRFGKGNQLPLLKYIDPLWKRKFFIYSMIYFRRAMERIFWVMNGKEIYFMTKKVDFIADLKRIIY